MRRGKFAVSDFFRELAPLDEVILHKCRVIAVEHQPNSALTVYEAECDEFDELAPGEAVPPYAFAISEVMGKLRSKAIRLNDASWVRGDSTSTSLSYVSHGD